MDWLKLCGRFVILSVYLLFHFIRKEHWPRTQLRLRKKSGPEKKVKRQNTEIPETEVSS